MCGPAMRISCWSIASTRIECCARAAAVGLIIRDPRSQPGLGTQSANLRRHAGAERSAAAGHRRSPRERRHERADASFHRSRWHADRSSRPTADRSSLQKLRLLPGVIPALKTLRDAGYALVMVSNQDGLGTARFPESDLPRAAGIPARAAGVARHRPSKPSSSARTWLRTAAIAASRKPVCSMSSCASMPSTSIAATSSAIATPTWSSRATWGSAAFACTATHAGRDVAADRRAPHRALRTRAVARKTKETDIQVEVRPRPKKHRSESPPASASSITCWNRSRSTAVSLCSSPATAICISTSTTPSRTARSRWGRRSKRRSATSAASSATAFCCRWTKHLRRSLSICRAAPTSCSKASSAATSVGQLPTELVPHFFRSLAETLGAAINIKVNGENTHHMIEACFKGVGRALRQAFRVTDTELPSTKGTL